MKTEVDLARELYQSLRSASNTIGVSLCSDSCAVDAALADLVRARTRFRLLSHVLDRFEPAELASWKQVDSLLEEIELNLCRAERPEDIAERLDVNIVQNAFQYIEGIIKLCQKTYQIDSPKDPKIRTAVFDLTGGLCAYCWQPLPDEWHLEHLVPREHGGPDNLANYVPSCPTCNSSKNADHVIHFINRRFGRVIKSPANDDCEKDVA